MRVENGEKRSLVRKCLASCYFLTCHDLKRGYDER